APSGGGSRGGNDASSGAARSANSPPLARSGRTGQFLAVGDGTRLVTRMVSLRAESEHCERKQGGHGGSPDGVHLSSHVRRVWRRSGSRQVLGVAGEGGNPLLANPPGETGYGLGSMSD